MRSSTNQATRKGSSQQITKSITLLQQTRNNTTRLQGTVLKGSRCSITVETTHGNTEQSTASQELLVGLAETSTQFENHEQQLVHHKGPFPSPAIGCNTKGNSTDRSQHQYQGDTPGDIGDRLVKGRSQLGCGQGDGKEIKGIPCPAEKGDLYTILVLGL